MSKERGLLNLCAVAFKARDICPLLLKDISELLAQPEQDNIQYLLDQVARLTAENAMLKEKGSTQKREPIEEGELEVWYSQHTWAMDKQEYMWGFRDAEQAHGIGGGE
jgi:hypothetical protein